MSLGGRTTGENLLSHVIEMDMRGLGISSPREFVHARARIANCISDVMMILKCN
jgi:hypothetical protein